MFNVMFTVDIWLRFCVSAAQSPLILNVTVLAYLWLTEQCFESVLDSKRSTTHTMLNLTDRDVFVFLKCSPPNELSKLLLRCAQLIIFVDTVRALK